MSENYLSYSQLCDWLQCRYKWFLGYDYAGTGLEMQADSDALVTGSAVHAGLEWLLRIRSTYESYGATHETATYDDARDAIINAIDRGVLPAQEDDEDLEKWANIAWLAYQRIPWDQYRVFSVYSMPAVEVYVEAPLQGFDGFRGYVDLILEDRKTGALWIVDHKVKKQFASSRDLEPYIQLALYQYVLKQQGYNIAGSILHEIRSDLLDVWKVCESGDLVRKSGRGNSAPIKFSRLYRSDAELDAIWSRVVLPVAKELAEYRISYNAGDFDVHNLEPNDAWVSRVLQPNICGMCSFRELCFAGLRGDDTEFLLDELYQPKQSR